MKSKEYINRQQHFVLWIALAALSLSPIQVASETLYCKGMRLECQGSSERCLSVLRQIDCDSLKMQDVSFQVDEDDEPAASSKPQQSALAALRSRISEFLVTGPYQPKTLPKEYDYRPFGELQDSLGMSAECMNPGSGEECQVNPNPVKVLTSLVKVWKMSADSLFTLGQAIGGNSAETPSGRAARREYVVLD